MQANRRFAGSTVWCGAIEDYGRRDARVKIPLSRRLRLPRTGAPDAGTAPLIPVRYATEARHMANLVA
jgi:hypothetical protein